MDKPLSKSNIRQRRLTAARKVLLPLILLACLLMVARWALTPSLERSEIRTAKAIKGAITATINAGGLVVPLHEQTLSSEIDSQIVRVFVEPGSQVKKGEPLLQLATQGLELSIATIEEKLALKDSQIESKRLLLNKSINDINSRYALLQVDLESRSTRAERLERLNKVANVTSAHKMLEARLDVKRTNIELQQLEQAHRDLTSSSEAEINALNLEKSLLNKELTEQRRLLGASTLTASRDGILSWIKQEIGASVATREPLAKIADASQFRIQASLSDFYASRLIRNMPAQIRYNDKTITGRLASSTPTIKDGVMNLIINLDKPHHKDLYHNLRVDVGLVIDSVDDTLTLAKGPFINGAGLQQVFVLRDDIAYRREIEVGLSNSEYHQILHGLQQGEEVIISDVKDMLHLNQFNLD